MSHKLKVEERHSLASYYTLTTENSLNVGLRAGYLSVRTAGGASDRCGLKVRSINELTYLHFFNGDYFICIYYEIVHEVHAKFIQVLTLREDSILFQLFYDQMKMNHFVQISTQSRLHTRIQITKK